jgi:hypothetical protein
VPNQSLHQTGAATLASRGITVQQTAPAGELWRSACAADRGGRNLTMQKPRAGLLLALAVIAGCGTKAAKLQNDQTVELKGDTPVALVVDPLPQHYDMTLEITADQPINVALVLNRPVGEAVAQAKKQDGSKYAQDKANPKAHKIESTIGENVRAVLVMWQGEGAGQATVQVKRTK